MKYPSKETLVAFDALTEVHGELTKLRMVAAVINDEDFDKSLRSALYYINNALDHCIATTKDEEGE